MINAVRIVSLQGKWPRQNRGPISECTFFSLLFSKKKKMFLCVVLLNAFSLRISSRQGVINQHKLCNSVGDRGGEGAGGKGRISLFFMCFDFLFLYFFCLFYLSSFVHFYNLTGRVGDKSRRT